MPDITGAYERIKEPRLQFSYAGSYEVGEVLSWAVAIYRNNALAGKPNGRIDVSGLPVELYERLVAVAVEASIENGTGMRE